MRVELPLMRLRHGAGFAHLALNLTVARPVAAYFAHHETRHQELVLSQVQKLATFTVPEISLER
jgi:hypothetical protein